MFSNHQMMPTDGPSSLALINAGQLSMKCDTTTSLSLGQSNNRATVSAGDCSQHSTSSLTATAAPISGNMPHKTPYNQ